MTSSNLKPALIAVVLSATAVVTTGCGSTTVVRVQESTTITKGQELIDLLRALNEGAIDQRDYDYLRDRIQRRPN